MPDTAKRQPEPLLKEHIGSRKEWGAYVELMTRIRENRVAQVDEFVADLRTQIKRALRRAS
jgi:hypothetical protein